MRASRLLQLLLLLQNRGRMTSAELAREVEVTPRTILRDVDAMTQAGLPIVVHRGNGGGIELGFNYRTRLTGLAPDEAEALAVILNYPIPELSALGIERSASRARSKLLESLPDAVRNSVTRATQRFRFDPCRDDTTDLRVEALARAIREAKLVRINTRSQKPQTIRPVALLLSNNGWQVVDQGNETRPIALEHCGDINISASSFRASCTAT